jgi:hypothetical protein
MFITETTMKWLIVRETTIKSCLLPIHNVLL